MEVDTFLQLNNVNKHEKEKRTGNTYRVSDLDRIQQYVKLILTDK